MIPFIEWVDTAGFHLQQTYDPETNQLTGPGKLVLLPHQRDILGHCLTPDKDGKLPYTTVVFSCVKKSGKTTIAAGVGTWFSEQAPPGTEIYCIANDQEQAQGRVYRDIAYHVKHIGKIQPFKAVIEYDNGTFIRALAQEYKSAAGSRHALTIWDELWAYQSATSRLMWAEMTPVPTVPLSLRFVATYAGVLGKSELLEDLYKKIVTNGEPVPELAHLVDTKGRPVCFKKGRMFAYWDTIPRMPWQTDEYYEEQMENSRPSDFLRQHRNEWVTEFEEFIPIEWWDACCTLEAPLTFKQEADEAKWPIVIGVDVGVVHDCSAIVGVYYDSRRGKVGVAFHKIWTPTKENPLDLEDTVEAEILRMKERFNISAVVYDPTNFHRSMTTLRDKFGLTMVEYPQSPGRMELVGQAFYDAIRGKYLECYKDDQLRAHIQFVTAENRGRGFRLVKGEKMGRPIDAAIALAMAVHYSIETGGVDVSRPIRIEVPFASTSAWKPLRTDLLKLPPQFRDKSEEYE